VCAPLLSSIIYFHPPLFGERDCEMQRRAASVTIAHIHHPIYGEQNCNPYRMSQKSRTSFRVSRQIYGLPVEILLCGRLFYLIANVLIFNIKTVAIKEEIIISNPKFFSSKY
jgi:hypothetical protein